MKEHFMNKILPTASLAEKFDVLKVTLKRVLGPPKSSQFLQIGRDDRLAQLAMDLCIFSPRRVLAVKTADHWTPNLVFINMFGQALSKALTMLLSVDNLPKELPL